jgi:CubicO group peptidase (beta-lactamase class C family)
MDFSLDRRRSVERRIPATEIRSPSICDTLDARPSRGFERMKRCLVRIVILLFLSGLSAAIDVPSKKVDHIFSAYNQPNSPGCSLGVIRNGKFIYRKAYGTASLELGVPLSDRSVFYLASVSKQFTAASVVLAAEQGYISLDDDVRKYIPELPDYGHRITLRQMLHQTSGLRDFLSLTYLSGRDISDLSSPDDVLKLITRQQALNNVPGDEFVYSNTNYFLLGVVIQRATKKSLAEFAAQNIFQPLGMSHTLYYDDNTLVVPDRVAAYDPGKNGKFAVDWSTTYDIVGGGGLMSSVDDLFLWDNNFYSNKLGKGTLVQELQTQGVLNNGNRINYAMGLWLDHYRGVPTVEHGGGTFGYRTDILRFPEQRFSVIALCNVSSADPEGLSRKVADLFLEGTLHAAPTDSDQDALPDPAPFAGNYLDPRTHMIYTFTAKDGHLMAWGATLRRSGPNQFYDLVGNPITFTESVGVMSARLDLEGETYFDGKKVPDIHLAAADLRPLAGRYRSEELDAIYTLSMEQENLMLSNRNQKPVKLVPIAPDEFKADDMGTVVVQHDPMHRVSGLTVFESSARGIEFKKED